MLLHLVRRLQGEGEGADDAESAERGHGAVEPRVPPPDRHCRAVRDDQLHLAHGRGQRPVADSRAMGAGRHRTGHRDVRQGRHVGQREPVGVDRAGQFGVAHPTGHPDRARGRVDLDHRRQPGGGQQYAVRARLGDPVEGVPAAQHSHPRTACHQRREGVERARAVEVPRGVRDGARPVGDRPGGPCRPCHSCVPPGECVWADPLTSPDRGGRLPADFVVVDDLPGCIQNFTGRSSAKSVPSGS